MSSQKVGAYADPHSDVQPQDMDVMDVYQEMSDPYDADWRDPWERDVWAHDSQMRIENLDDPEGKYAEHFRINTDPPRD